jgi:hypothetical protein
VVINVPDESRKQLTEKHLPAVRKSWLALIAKENEWCLADANGIYRELAQRFYW